MQRRLAILSACALLVAVACSGAVGPAASPPASATQPAGQGPPPSPTTTQAPPSPSPTPVPSLTPSPVPIERVILVPDDHWRAIYSNMGFRTEPAVLWGHEYWPGHVYERYVHRHNPAPVRRGHRDGAHSQGWCFYHEELPVALDFPFVRGPRGRELPFINMIQRAERISMGIDLLSGKITPDEAYKTFRKNVPPLGSGLGATREEAFEEVEGVLVRGRNMSTTLRHSQAAFSEPRLWWGDS